MLDHGLIASHASKSLFFLQIQTKPGRVSYREDIHGLSPSAIQKLYQSTDLVVHGAAHSITNQQQKALGTQTVSQPPRPQRFSTAKSTLPPVHFPSRSSSILKGGGKSMPSHKRRLLKTSPRQPKCKHFSSIDGMLASASASDESEDLCDAPSLAHHSERRSRNHFNTAPKRKRPSLNRPSTYIPSSEPIPMKQQPSYEEPITKPPLPSSHRPSTSLPPSRRPSSSSSPVFPPKHTFPTTTLAITHHPAAHLPSTSLASTAATSTSGSPAKRPSLHEPHTFSWTSDATRRLEYAKIDRAYSGLRGFCRRMLPGMCFRDGRRNFWDDAEKCRDGGGKRGMKGDDGDGGSDSDGDGDSVRRYRLRLQDPPSLDGRGEGEGDGWGGEKRPLVTVGRGASRGLSCF